MRSGETRPLSEVEMVTQIPTPMEIGYRVRVFAGSRSRGGGGKTGSHPIAIPKEEQLKYMKI